ncbi:protein SpAN-like [Brevipalpus obovatus]|uniref:protein SpAN-like n=1 Tax=Brevipalpus obovatus TaxID=246614 RepID=UPI003D9ECB44
MFTSWLTLILSILFLVQMPLGYESMENIAGDLNGDAELSPRDDEQINQFDAMFKMAGGGNPDRTPDGDLIIDGDIVVGQSDEDNQLTGRKAIPDTSLYWPNGTIPYLFHKSVSDGDKKIIMHGIQHWQNETCIKFIPATSKDHFKIRFRSDQEGCWSLVGRHLHYYGRTQDVSIGNGCVQWTTVAHEIGHVIGFYHEQSRSDRDKAIHINWENVLRGFDIQFRKESDQNFGVPYDYTSVMQYPGWAFSKEILVKNTIVTNDPKYQRLLGVNKGLTFRDKKIVSNLYGCNRDCPNLMDTKCLNGGFLKAYRGDNQNCECECPPNTDGKFCQTIRMDDYYDAIDPLICGGNISQATQIFTPNYGQKNVPKQSCVWNVKAPDGQFVQMEFIDFDFTPRFETSNRRLYHKCLNESVEIRDEDLYHGSFYCGHDFKEGDKIVSKTSRLLILVYADRPSYGRGLKANISFVQESGDNMGDEIVSPDPWKRKIGGKKHKKTKTKTKKTTSTTPSWMRSTYIPVTNVTLVPPQVRPTTEKPKFKIVDVKNILDKMNKIQQGRVVKKIPPTKIDN